MFNSEPLKNNHIIIDMSENYILHTSTNTEGTVEILHTNKDVIKTEASFYYKDSTLHVSNVETDTLVTRSDERYKKDIVDINDNLSQSILELRPKQYKYKNNNKSHYGFIAQDIQQLFPNLVNEDDETGFLRVNYVELIPILIASYKNLHENVSNIRKELSELKKLTITNNGS